MSLHNRIGGIMDFYHFKKAGLQFARDKALNDPTYMFGSLKLASTIEMPDERGAFRQYGNHYSELCHFLRDLEKQGVLVKIREGTERVGRTSFSQEYFSFRDINHPTLLKLLEIKDPEMDKRQQEMDLLMRQTKAAEMQSQYAAEQSKTAIEALKQSKKDAVRSRIISWFSLGVAILALIFSLAK